LKHFSDRAPAEATANVEEISASVETITVETAPDPLDNEEADSTAASQDPAADELSYADQQRLAIEEKREGQREKQAERQRICLQARDELARVEPNRRVYSTDDDGETTRMDDDQRVNLVEENKQLVAEYCE
jgi:hypothetical protein